MRKKSVERLTMTRHLFVYFDGAARANPLGPASAAIYCRLGARTWGKSQRLGVRTNNQAEFAAVSLALREAASLATSLDAVTVRGDSRLVIEALRGRFAIRAPTLVDAHAEARSLLTALPTALAVKLEWIPRSANASADALANRALDETPKRKRTNDDDGDADDDDDPVVVHKTPTG